MNGYDPIFGATNIMAMIESFRFGNRKSNRKKISKNRKNNDGQYKADASWKEIGKA